MRSRLANTAVLLTILMLFVATIALYVSISTITVRGSVRDAMTQEPLAGADISAGSRTTLSDAQGHFALAGVARNLPIVIGLDGYHGYQATAPAIGWLEREATLNAGLQPTVMSGVATAAGSGQPVAGAAVTVGGETEITGADGAYRFVRVRQGAAIEVWADRYDDLTLTFDGESAAKIELTPNVVRAATVDADGSPVDATLSVDGQAAPGDGQGRFVLTGVARQASFAAQADGYLPATASYAGGPAVTMTLQANSVSGQTRDTSGQALAGITVTLQQAGAPRTTLSAEGGSFSFRRVITGAVLTAIGQEHAPAVLTYTGQPSLTFTLRPDTLRGVARDFYSGQPMAAISVTLRQGGSAVALRSDERGAFQFARAALGAVVTAEAPGHAPAVITYTGQLSVDLVLRPNMLQGVVRDGQSGQPVAGAAVSVGDVLTKTATNGSYALPVIGDGQQLLVSASGYDRVRLPVGQATSLDVKLQPFAARAIYIPFYLLTDPERVRALISFADRAGMNALVVDIKSDYGYLAYKSDLPLAKEIKAADATSMIGMDELLKLAKQHGLYVIARMTVFKDNLLAEARPDLAVRDKRTNAVWDDCGNGTTYWVDPFRKEVVDYNVGIAEEAAGMGFDEVQFDYIRFPPACSEGAPMADASFAVTPTMETRLGAIEAFLAEAQKRLKPRGVAISVDTFGWTLFLDTDDNIGQRMENMAKYVDYISPMVYPSTWEEGARGLGYVPAHPYDIVFQSISYGVARLKDIPGVKIRPWLQDFDDRKLPYGIKELDAQRQGAADAGAVGWMLWNVYGAYTEETTTRP